VTTTKQSKANRANAQYSTGPKSREGKQSVSGNRITHGILSRKLLLRGEREEEYQSLLKGLISDLQPEGTLELALVEKIAVSFWRQRRLVAAENGATELAASRAQTVGNTYDAWGLSDYAGQELRLALMGPPEDAQQEWCRNVLTESEVVKDVTLLSLQDKCPLIYQQLLRDAGNSLAVRAYIDNYSEGGLMGYVEDLVKWCRRYLWDAARYPEFQALVSAKSANLSVPWEKLELLSKYQAALDNQLYKAITALAYVQERRLNFAAMNAKEVT
jgi:hypothetical protein